MKKLIFILLPILSFSQVGINTTEPKAKLHINGDLIIKDVPTISNATYVLVVDPNDENRVKKVLLSSLSNINNTCPNLIKNESSGYFLKFISNSSIPNPNNSITVQGKTFNPAGTYTQNNNYIFSYTNITGQAININIPFTITFTNLTCQY